MNSKSEKYKELINRAKIIFDETLKIAKEIPDELDRSLALRDIAEVLIDISKILEMIEINLSKRDLIEKNLEKIKY